MYQIIAQTHAFFPSIELMASAYLRKGVLEAVSGTPNNYINNSIIIKNSISRGI